MGFGFGETRVEARDALLVTLLWSKGFRGSS